MRIRTVVALAALALAIGTAGNVRAAHPRMRGLLQATPRNHTIVIHGSNFPPGSSVRFTVINSQSDKVLARDTVAVSDKNYQCPVEFGPVCSQANPGVGQLDDWITIPRSGSTRLSLRYRDGSINGVVAVLQR